MNSNRDPNKNEIVSCFFKTLDNPNFMKKPKFTI